MEESAIVKLIVSIWLVDMCKDSKQNHLSENRCPNSLEARSVTYWAEHKTLPFEVAYIEEIKF